MPDFNSSAKLFRIHLRGVECERKGIDCNSLAKKTDGYSVADIDRVVKNALQEPLRDVQNATHFIRVDEKRTPSSKHEFGAVKKSLREIPSDELKDSSPAQSSELCANRDVKFLEGIVALTWCYGPRRRQSGSMQ